MADSFSPTLNLCKPEIDQSAETWGQKLNADLDLLDQFAASMNALWAGNDANIRHLISLVIPYGVVLAWTGLTTAVPAGWHLCDGTNGTPNLVDRFILSTAGVRNMWETGGTFQEMHQTDAEGQHSHGGSVVDTALVAAQMPSHRHGGNTDTQGNHTHTYSAIVGGGGGQIGAGGSPAQGASPETSVSGIHGHNVVTDYQGGSQPHSHGIWPDGSHIHNVVVNVVPPYFVLAYIMKV